MVLTYNGREYKVNQFNLLAFVAGVYKPYSENETYTQWEKEIIDMAEDLAYTIDDGFEGTDNDWVEWDGGHGRVIAEIE